MTTDWRDRFKRKYYLDLHSFYSKSSAKMSSDLPVNLRTVVSARGLRGANSQDVELIADSGSPYESVDAGIRDDNSYHYSKPRNAAEPSRYV